MITDYLNIRQAAAWYLRPCLGTCGKVFILMSFKIRGEMNTYNNESKLDYIRLCTQADVKYNF